MATVNGSWILKNTCDSISPLNGLPIKNIINKAPARDTITPILE
jgi:hypothetical protein